MKTFYQVILRRTAAGSVFDLLGFSLKRSNASRSQWRLNLLSEHRTSDEVKRLGRITTNGYQ